MRQPLQGEAPHNRGVDAAVIADRMHADSVDLWNAFWQEAGEPSDADFPHRASIERIQRELGAIVSYENERKQVTNR
jgi:hypothetical protein